MHRLPALTRRALLSTLAAGAVAAHASDTDWPKKPIRLIVPFAPGISADIVARMVAEPLARVLGQPVVVDNRAGASGIIGVELGAKSPPDGYTIVLAVDSLVGVMPHIYSKLPYDPLKDLVPITQLTAVPIYLLVAAESPYKNLRDLVAAAKAKPGTLTYGSLGIGSGAHVRAEFMNNLAGTTMVHIPYKASPIPEILGGLVATTWEPATTAIPLVRSGKMRALAVSSPKRTAALPDVPTGQEILGGTFDIDGWHALYAPAGTPPAIVQRLSQEVVKIVKSPEISQKLADLGVNAIGSSPQECGAFSRAEYQKWGKVARDNHIRAD